MTTPIPVSDLTSATLEGNGVFDVLMKATKAHLESEYTKNRIKGTEYSTVYLGSLEAVMRTALEFIVQRQKVALEAELMSQQILLTQAEVAKANAQVLLVEEQILNAQAERALLTLNQDKVNAEITQLGAQTALTTQQKDNLAAEALNIPKQGLLLDAQKAQVTQQTLNLAADKLLIDAKAQLTTQQADNAVTEGAVLLAQKCKLEAEYDVLLQTKLKTIQETTLLAQKVATEKAQTMALGVDGDSIIGKQKALYQAQTDGFQRDAEQKAAKLMVDSWNVRRTTDEGTVADTTNMLNDASVGRAVTKLLSGVGA